MIGVFKTAMVLLAVFVLQVELFSDTRIFNVMPELLLGATIAGAWVAGAERGASVGFCAGLLYDLFLPSPLALTSLSYLLVGYGVGTMTSGFRGEEEGLLRQILSVISVAIGILLFVILGELLSDTAFFTDRFFTILLVSTLYTALFLPLLHRMMSWALADISRGSRTSLTMNVLE